jgi:hypothetical protein
MYSGNLFPPNDLEYPPGIARAPDMASGPTTKFHRLPNSLLKEPPRLPEPFAQSATTPLGLPIAVVLSAGLAELEAAREAATATVASTAAAVTER